MAVKIWNGTTGVYSTAGNWVGGVAPVAADDVVFDDTSIHDVTGSDETAVDLASFTVTGRYTGSIGSAGTPLQVKGTRATIKTGGDALYIDGQFDHSYLGPASAAANACQWGGANGSLGFVSVGRGRIVIRSGSTWGNDMVVFNALGGMGDVEGPNVTIESGQSFSAAEELYVSGGLVTVNDSLDQAGSLITVVGGRVVLNDSGTTPKVIVGGGTLQHDDGTITVAIVCGAGIWDASRSVKARVVTTMWMFGPECIGDWRNGSATGFPSTFSPLGDPTIKTDSPYPVAYSFS